MKSLKNSINESFDKKKLVNNGDELYVSSTCTFRLNSLIITGIITDINNGDVFIKHKGEHGITSKKSWKHTKIKPDQIISQDKFSKWEINENFNESVNEKARAPKLTGRELKARKAKAEVMKKLEKSSKFQTAKEKLIKVAELEVKNIAREIGVPHTLIDLSKIKITNDH
jgi:hypothetical protein